MVERKVACHLSEDSGDEPVASVAPVALGKGSHGVVIPVEQDHQLFACKVMKPLDDHQGIAHTTLRECDAYSRLKHPCMTDVYYVDIDQHVVKLWMGLADMDLTHYIQQETDFQKRLVVAAQVLYSILSVLKYLHHHHILHRDIKPDNILLKYQSREPFSNSNSSFRPKAKSELCIYLSDFGAVRSLDSLHSTKQASFDLTPGMGTKYYRPPEMLSNKYGKPSDIYTLGCTIVHILHGQLPEVCTLLDHCDPKHWIQTLQRYESRIGVTLFELLKSMLCSSAQLRITARQALKHAFFHKIPKSPMAALVDLPLPPSYEHRYPALDRKNVIDWMLNVGWSFNHSLASLIHAVYLFDDYMFEQEESDMPPTQLVAAVCVWLASKFFDGRALQVQHWVEICDQEFSVDDFLNMEEHVVIVLKFRLFRRHLPQDMGKSLNFHQVHQRLTSADWLIPDLSQLSSNDATTRIQLSPVTE